jgi:hypothetical protein
MQDPVMAELFDLLKNNSCQIFTITRQLCNVGLSLENHLTTAICLFPLLGKKQTISRDGLREAPLRGQAAIGCIGATGYSFVLHKSIANRILVPAKGINNEDAPEVHALPARYSFVPFFLKTNEYQVLSHLTQPDFSTVAASRLGCLHSSKPSIMSKGYCVHAV